MNKKYQIVVDATEDSWKFKNFTTSQIIELTIGDPDGEGQKIVLDYQEFEALKRLLDNVIN